MTPIAALGDSLTWHPHSWAWQLAATTNSPLHNAAVYGATAADLAAQDPQLSSPPVLLLLIGANDVRSGAFDGERYEQDVRGALRRTQADQTLLVGLPDGLNRLPGLAGAGRARIDQRIKDANQRLQTIARDDETVTYLDVRDLGRPRYMQADMLHLNPAGHFELARRALTALPVLSGDGRFTPGPRPRPAVLGLGRRYLRRVLPGS